MSKLKGIHGKFFDIETEVYQFDNPMDLDFVKDALYVSLTNLQTGSKFNAFISRDWVKDPNALNYKPMREALKPTKQSEGRLYAGTSSK